ncbi:protein C19orf12 homolog isoform X3 [Acanthaster planci]|nr:protein C19orf12 homolog isoform X3 [Acanthaster planci]XP_022092143.1 protein C19orf12 homolog isoform X3 [Acanthaster planci]
MPVSPEELVRLLALLATEENLKVTVKETLKGGAMAGAGAVIGGFCGGPIGIAVGGTLGGMMARWKYRGTCRLVTDLLTELSKEQREQLHEHFQLVLGDYNIDNSASMNRLVNQDGEYRARMVQVLKAFVTDIMKLQLYEEVLTRGKAE